MRSNNACLASPQPIPSAIEAILRDGAARLRKAHATPALRALREAVGLRDLSRSGGDTGKAAMKVGLPAFKQYRETDGRFYFKLVDGDRVLLQSGGFDSPKDAGQRIAALRRDGFVQGDGGLVTGEDASAADIEAALARLVAADREKAAARKD